MNRNVDKWTITVRTSDGQGTVHVDVEDAWARLWRRAAVAGRPTGEWVGIGFRLAGAPYSLGFMAVSNGGRPLWFPTANLQAILYDEDASLTLDCGKCRLRTQSVGVSSSSRLPNGS